MSREPQSDYDLRYEQEMAVYVEEAVNGLSPTQQDEYGNYSDLLRSIHLRKDAFGNPISDAQVQVLKNQLAHLRLELAEKYSGGNILEMESLMARQGLSNLAVKERLANMYARREGD